MAHEIENEQIAYAGETPWHGIGTKLEEGATPAEFLKAAGLDWTVKQIPLYGETEDGTKVRVPTHTALVRSTDNKVMTITGKNWKPMQNADVLDFMTRYTDAGGAKMETAGALRDGKIIWGLARLGHSFEVRPGDKVNGYLLITSPHVVGKAITVSTTTVRVVCANTMAAAEYDRSIHYSQDHRREFNVDSAKFAVELAHEQLAAAETRCKTLDRLKLSLEDAVKQVIIPVFEPQLLDDTAIMDRIMEPEQLAQHKRLSAIVQSLQTAPGAIEGTGWGALNGVTHWCDHIGGHEAATRMFRSWMGDYRQKKLKVEHKLMELAA